MTAFDLNLLESTLDRLYEAGYTREAIQILFYRWMGRMATEERSAKTDSDGGVGSMSDEDLVEVIQDALPKEKETVRIGSRDVTVSRGLKGVAAEVDRRIRNASNPAGRKRSEVFQSSRGPISIG